MKWWQRMAMTLVGLLMAGTSSATILRIATLSPDGSAWMQTLRAAAAEIKQKTAGRVDFRFYTGGSMGNDNTVLSKVRVGELAGGGDHPVEPVRQRCRYTALFSAHALSESG